MFENANPKQISFWAAMLVTFIFSCIFYGFKRYFQLELSGFVVFNILILVLFLVYQIIYWCIDKFVYKKVKILYKTILKHKAIPESLKKTDSDQLFSDVENDVLKFVVESQNQIQSLKTLEQYRRNFVANVSHELRTPIFNIQGFLHTLIDGGMEDPELTERYLQRAAQNTERLEIIINDLETISKLESGNIPLQLNIFSIKSLVETVFEDLERLAAEKNIKLKIKENASLSYKVKANEESIRRVLDNLIKNAIKYTPSGSIVKVGFYEMDQHILIEVADNGNGIEDVHLPYLFDRFYRVDKGRSRNEGGSGLGLSIVKHIIEAHQQTINVRSTVGKGTTFGFTLNKSH